MYTYNIMASIAKIIILIISGDALYALSNDTNRPDARVSNTSSYVKQESPFKRRCDDGVIDLFFGCTITTVRSYPKNRDYYDTMLPKDPSSFDTEYVISNQGGMRVRRQSRSYSPPRSMTKNINRRSSSIPETVVVRQMPVSNRPQKEPSGKSLILTFLTTLYSPSALI